MQNGVYSIGEAAKLAGITVKMIRRYEADGLLAKAPRRHNGYRTYQEKDLHVLRFIRQARALGFPIKHIQTLLDLWQDQHRPSSQVKALAQLQIATLQSKMDELQAMQTALHQLVECCSGNERPDCPILDSLAK